MDPDIKLKPGTYKLKYSTKNPEADRRVKRDWRKAAEWQAGKIFIVENDLIVSDMVKERLVAEGVDISKLPAEVFMRTSIRPADGGFSHQDMHERSAIYQALAPNLEPCTESPEALLTRLEINRRYNDWDFFLFLIERMGHEWFEINWNDYLSRGE